MVHLLSSSWYTWETLKGVPWVMIAEPTLQYPDLERLMASAKSIEELSQIIVSAPYEHKLVEMAMLFLGFICFYLIDEDSQEAYLVSVSDTEQYRLAIRDYPFDASKFRLALDNTDNDIVRAIVDNKTVQIDDWSNLKRPEATSEVVRLNQASSGIATTYVYPLSGKKRGALMFNYFQYTEAIGEPQKEFMDRYSALVAGALDSL